ncbi:erythropoiesis-stimulating protein [Streptomyces sp. PVA_94-07]|nr:erythropoiesis-stimulating protein [Streptomyces sp. PVA_94-07]
MGLDETAESVYRLMLSNRGWGAREVSVHLRQPERAVHDALDRLSELRLLRRGGATGEAWQVVGPEIGLQLLLGRRESELRRKQMELVESQQAMQHLLHEYSALGPGGLHELEHLPTADAADERAAQLLRSSTKECLALLPRQSTVMGSGRQTERALPGCRERGVHIAVVCHGTDRERLSLARRLGSRGVEVRAAASLPVGVLLFDRVTAMLPITSPGQETEGAAVCLSGVRASSPPWAPSSIRSGRALLLRMAACAQPRRRTCRRLNGRCCASCVPDAPMRWPLAGWG